jgi:hypothetical protein
MNLQDTFYNWLSIKQVKDARPDDNAAQDTYQFFDEILTEDHNIEKKEVQKEGYMYVIQYWVDGVEKEQQFPIDLIDALLQSIESEPKYNS